MYEICFLLLDGIKLNNLIIICEQVSTVTPKNNTR